MLLPAVGGEEPYSSTSLELSKMPSDNPNQPQSDEQRGHSSPTGASTPTPWATHWDTTRTGSNSLVVGRNVSRFHPPSAGLSGSSTPPIPRVTAADPGLATTAQQIRSLSNSRNTNGRHQIPLTSPGPTLPGLGATTTSRPETRQATQGQPLTVENLAAHNRMLGVSEEIAARVTGSESVAAASATHKDTVVSIQSQLVRDGGSRTQGRAD
ncbi:hypothetical protein K461DRAFT_67076 [Myriangium duriaei CBS 260.36]|uniref:Uncharacterized protein n=1 Tax=Myriangium duriaei CBS 260.36 TaxID=1168546 RepID=A0A9P4IT00_9PEZI|nr:hypothetical protein K461DRAFT_67076 [Myriangium duriaei CBS 260.36]